MDEEYDGGLDPNLLNSLEILDNDIDYNNDDAVILLCGRPGRGKTRFASQIANWFMVRRGIIGPGEKCPIKTCFFDTKDYINYARRTKRNVMMLDESYRTLSSKRTMSAESVEFNAMFNEVRVNQHVHIILIQDFFEMQSNIVFSRANIMLFVYRIPNPTMKRHLKGFFKMYGEHKMKSLYINGKKYHNMTAYSWDDGTGRFDDKLMFELKDYNKKKDDFIAEWNKKKDDKKEASRTFINELGVVSWELLTYLTEKKGMFKKDAYEFIAGRISDALKQEVKPDKVKGWIDMLKRSDIAAVQDKGLR